MGGIGAETWLMHGSLLGWYWNRKIMPWDSDIDVQITEKSMQHLAEFYNMTVHRFNLPNEGHTRDYLLEINPNWANPSTTDSNNKIDARWLDMTTGLYVDITTLRRDLQAEASGTKGALMCKDKHRYVNEDIFPLRDTMFENVPAKVPFAYADVLTQEYGASSLQNTIYMGHRFDTVTGGCSVSHTTSYIDCKPHTLTMCRSYIMFVQVVLRLQLAPRALFRVGPKAATEAADASPGDPPAWIMSELSENEWGGMCDCDDNGIEHEEKLYARAQALAQVMGE
ncbi:hypothetical protein Q7P35_008976 [Cladosporium inversicolor]